MNKLIVLGSNSFLGRSILKNIGSNFLVKAVVRKIPSDAYKFTKNVEWIKVDTLNTLTLNNIFKKGDIVINLIYIKGDNKSANLSLIKKITNACIYNKVSRLIHCSTASVVGDVRNRYINELSPCNPYSNYEKVKLEIEKIVLKGLSRELDIGILRPTAIVGYGGKNLKKLANSLICGNKFINYLKRCFFGKMPMHLVPVNYVVSAILHLSVQKNYLNGRIFIVSLDEDINNNFCDVEKILLNELGMTSNKFPTIYVPKILQKILSRILNRSDLNPDRKYVSINLEHNSFQPKDTIKDAIIQFAKSIKKN